MEPSQKVNMPRVDWIESGYYLFASKLFLLFIYFILLRRGFMEISYDFDLLSGNCVIILGGGQVF